MTSTPSTIHTSHGFCVNQVRKYDRENYLAALFIEDHRIKRIVFALRAFNVELSQIRDRTSDSDRAKIRFHFWSKLIDEIAKGHEHAASLPTSELAVYDEDKLAAYYKHTPVASELMEILRVVEYDDEINKCLRDLIGARLSSKVLGYKPFDTMAELETYCSKSSSSLYRLILAMTTRLELNSDENYDERLTIYNSLGLAHGMTNIIRGIPYNASKNCCYLPEDLMKRYDITFRDFRPKKLDGLKLKPAVLDIAERCNKLVSEVKQSQVRLSRQDKQLLLPLVGVESYLKRLKKRDYNVCHPALVKQNGLLPLSMWLATKLRRAPIL